jgi:hypothetical protein
LAEFMIVWFVHLKNLLESVHINVITKASLEIFLILRPGFVSGRTPANSQPGSSPPCSQLVTFCP